MIELGLLLGNIIFGPYSAPIWAGVSGLIVLYVNNNLNKKKQTLDEHKDTREEFQIIKDSLYLELDRLKTHQVETSKSLLDADEETKKCEKRYFELAIQYKELLGYCAALAREVRDLKVHVSGLVSENKNANKTTTNKSNKDSTGK